MESYKNGTLHLADLALQFAIKKLSQKVVKKCDLKDALDTIKAVPWTKEILRELGTGRSNTILQLLRNLRTNSVTYAGIKNLFIDPIMADALGVEYWDLWNELGLKYHLFRSTPPREIREAIQKLPQGVIKTPLDLAALSKKEALVLDRSLFTDGTTLSLWQCAKCQFEFPTNRTTQRFSRDPKVATKLIQKIKGKTLEDTEISREIRDLAEQMGLPDNYDKLTPGAKVRALSNSALDRTMLTRFLTLGAELNILRAVKGSLPAVRSGINSYFRFCDLMARQPFPPTEDSVQLWSATFRPGPTFGNYLTHLKKAATLMNISTDWCTPAVTAMAKGLEKVMGRSFIFPNFIESADLLRVLRFVKVDTDLGQAFFLSYLFSLRVPSETLRLSRAFRDDRLTEFVPQEDKALIGIRTFKETEVLVIKFSFRKNIRNGCILMRPCLCGAASETALELCPVHAIWPHIRDRVGAGGPLFPAYTANIFNRKLKQTMTALKYPEGGKFSSHAFRRGATQEIKNSGSTLATIVKSGTWLSACYRNYLDLSADEAINISTLLLETLGSDSEDSDPDIIRKRPTQKAIIKRVRKVPMTFRNDPPEEGGKHTDSEI